VTWPPQPVVVGADGYGEVAVDWINLALGIGGIALAGVALSIQFRDRARLRITSIRPAIAGQGSSTGQWQHHITSVEVTIENEGSRPANACEAAITFAREEGLPLHPITRQHLADTTTRAFTVEPKARVHLVAAWQYTPDGAIDGTQQRFTPGQFLERCAPATVIVSCGTKETRGVLTEHEAQAIFDQHQAQVYLNA
jgi:hypothetical protein